MPDTIQKPWELYSEPKPWDLYADPGIETGPSLESKPSVSQRLRELPVVGGDFVPEVPRFEPTRQLAPPTQADTEQAQRQGSISDPVNTAMETMGRGLVGAYNATFAGPLTTPPLKYGEPLVKLAEPLTPEEEASIPPWAAGAYRSISKATTITPELALSLPFMALKPIQAAFALQQGLTVPGQVSHAKDVLSDPNATPIEKAEAVVDPLITGTFAGLAGHGALSREGAISRPTETKPVTEPVTLPATEEVAQPKENSASSQQETATLGRDVPSQPVRSESQVPVEESGQGVQPPEKTEEVSPVEAFTKTLDTPGAKLNNDLSTATGLKLTSVDDLDALAKVRDDLQAKRKALMDQAEKEKGDKSKTDPLIMEAIGLGQKAQLAREAIEVATNTGSWKEGEGKITPTKVGERPLDVANNPKVSDWLDQNSKKLGIDYEKPNTAAAARPTGRGLQTRTASTSAGEAGFIDLSSLNDFFDKTSDAVKSAARFIQDVGKEVAGPGRMTDYRRSVLNWSAKLQRSFGEAAGIQRDITKRVPDASKREAITNWIQANGDPAVLRQRASGSKDAKLRAGYEAALNLTPDELKVANEVKQRFADLEARGNRYDVLNSHRDNYVPQIWDLGKGPTGSAMGRTLKQKFRFSKARTFDNFFAGEQADFVPKTKDISKLLPVYMHEMESVIAARELVEDMSKGKASDGRPLVAAKGVGIPVDNPGTGKATLVLPKVSKEEASDYKVLPNNSALEGWKWAAKDDAGNNIFLKSDLSLHPEAYNRLKNVLGRSAIREWYNTPTTPAMQIPKTLVKGLDAGISEVKKTMLGVLAPFHQVQEGTHAVGHRVNPTFNIPTIDLAKNPEQMDAARHGLMLQPDRASENNFMEGFKQSKIISKIPGLGPAADYYSNYLFHEYIPGLKFKTYQAILDRNMKVYAKDLAGGKLAPEDVKTLSSEQANAAFGHLNYADLGRNPTIQHLAQIVLLAPDFLESRVRFTAQAAKGATGLKAGREQMLAVGALAIGQAALAYTSAKLTGGQWDEKRPFEMTKNGKRYTLRSVPEDIQKAIEDPRRFMHNRLSIFGKGALQYAEGVNYKGQKVTAGETTKELAKMPIPLMARGFMGVGELSGLDQIASSVGLRISKASPQQDLMEKAREWGLHSTNPKVKAEYERRAKEVMPDSVYKPLRQALEGSDPKKIVTEVKSLLANEQTQADKEKRMKEILHEFNPRSASGDAKHFATPSKAMELQFLKTLDPAGKAAYREALKERQGNYQKLRDALYGK